MTVDSRATTGACAESANRNSSVKSISSVISLA
jgi:hypothetical protein